MLDSLDESSPQDRSMACCDRKRKGEELPFTLDDVKTTLMPRQALLKKSDPTWSLTVPAVRVLLQPYQREYQRLIIQDRLDARLDIKGVLKIYKYFHLIKLQPRWPSGLRFHSGVLV